MTAVSPQEEAEWLQYSLRSSFFYRRRWQFKQLVQEVKQTDCAQYHWGRPSELGISPSSWAHIQSHSIPPCEVFCHPEVI